MDDGLHVIKNLNLRKPALPWSDIGVSVLIAITGLISVMWFYA